MFDSIDVCFNKRRDLRGQECAIGSELVYRQESALGLYSALSNNEDFCANRFSLPFVTMRSRYFPIE